MSAGGRWREYTGPIVLTSRKRLYYRGLFVLWLVLAALAAVTARFELLWVPLVGVAGTGALLWRDRAGRSALTGPPTE